MERRLRTRSFFDAAIQLLWLATEGLRAIFFRRIINPLSDPTCRISRGRFLAMMERVFHDEARLRREIYVAALRSLGQKIRVPPASAFRLPRPGSSRALMRRVIHYSRMLQAPDWFAHRLARRLVKMAREAESRQRHIAPVALQPIDCARCESDIAWIAPASSCTGRISLPRAPPWRLLTPNIANRPASQLPREVAGACVS
jgi:hypothetical protein